MQATQYIAPIPGGQGPGPMPPQGGYGYPGPGADADMQATQHIPQGGYGYPGPGGAGAAGDMQATQHIPPVQAQGGGDTQFLGTGPLPRGGGDSEATQYMPPVPAQPLGEERTQPPAEFDNLFRSDSAPQTPRQPQYQQPQFNQQPPPYQRQQQHQQQGQYGYQQDDQDYGYDPEPRRKAPVGAIAAVVIGCAVLGLGAGAVLSGGDKDDKGTGKNVANSSAAPSSQPSAAAADAAEPQAKELDKLLADSNNSRDAVIRSVASIRQCKNLDQAASDLRGAAEQRRGLVTRLQALSVDQLPKHAELTAALTKAWQASASADDHYAAWGDQMKGKKACKGGNARSTPQYSQANAKSGEATIAKREAAGLWNPTAEKYGLSKRQPTQL